MRLLSGPPGKHLLAMRTSPPRPFSFLTMALKIRAIRKLAAVASVFPAAKILGMTITIHSDSGRVVWYIVSGRVYRDAAGVLIASSSDTIIFGGILPHLLLLWLGNMPRDDRQSGSKSGKCSLEVVRHTSEWNLVGLCSDGVQPIALRLDPCLLYFGQASRLLQPIQWQHNEEPSLDVRCSAMNDVELWIAGRWI